jgi:hypothetical protein
MGTFQGLMADSNKKIPAPRSGCIQRPELVSLLPGQAAERVRSTGFSPLMIIGPVSALCKKMFGSHSASCWQPGNSEYWGGAKRTRRVMAGLVPAIHVFRRRERPQGSGEVKTFCSLRRSRHCRAHLRRRGVDGRVKPGHDGSSSEASSRPTPNAIRAKCSNNSKILRPNGQRQIDRARPPPPPRREPGASVLQFVALVGPRRLSAPRRSICRRR